MKWIATLVLLLAAGAAHAQLETDGPFDSRVRLELSDRARYERVDFFRTAPGSGLRNYDYGFFENRLQLGVRVLRDPLEVFVQYQNSLITSLPKNAPGPGGSYFANTPEVNQEQGILRNAWLRWKNPFDASGVSVQAGRQLFREGLEAPSADPTLLWLQKNRIAERLVGPFDYTNVGRSFDGAQVAYDDAAVNVTAFGFVPTWGGFEINANRQLEVGIAGVALSAKALEALPGTSGRLFGLWYRDRRDLLPVDNRPLVVREADDGDIEVYTLGANLSHVQAIGSGQLDVLVWGATQYGDWQSQSHDAWAYAFELGFQLPELWAKPWLRVGINQSSGDPDPGDDEHESFFQVLPTARLYALYPFYNLMNNRDLFGQLILRPAEIVTLTTTAHWLRVSQNDDLLYAGGGATSNSVFGYSGTATGGRNGIGTLVDLSLSVQATKNLTLTAYYAHVFGCGMIDQAFEGNDSSYAFAEATLAF
ncbi:MAG: alginate export family protein [Myxococcota bacterium]